MKNKAEAIIMSVCTVILAIGFVVLAVAHVQQSSLRSELRSDGVETPVIGRSFFDNQVRRLNPNTGDRVIVNEDAVLFTFRLQDGTEFTADQPIGEDRYDDLGAIGGLTAVYLSGDHENAELLQDGEFVANAVPYWIFAAIVGFLLVCSAAIAYRSSRPAQPGAETEPAASGGS